MYRLIRKIKGWAYHLVVVFYKICNTVYFITQHKNNVIVTNDFVRHKMGKIIPRNFGDDLNFSLIKTLSQRNVINASYSYISRLYSLNYVCIGSIVESKVNRKSVIWGSGVLAGEKDLKEKPIKVVAVRGPLTRNYLLAQGVECPKIYGDPSILLPLIYPCRKEKRFKMGLIPHYCDYETIFNKKNVERFNDEIVVIDLRNYKRWQDIVDLINECEFVASSSLHGLIVSDAYGIPNVWIRLSEKVKGGDCKFRDYLDGCGKENVKCLDLSKSGINYQYLLEEVKKYIQPNYNRMELLKACPFLSDQMKKQFGFNIL